jgi:translation elongation factor EF-Tu-like GTPase
MIKISDYVCELAEKNYVDLSCLIIALWYKMQKNETNNENILRFKEIFDKLISEKKKPENKKFLYKITDVLSCNLQGRVTDKVYQSLVFFLNI